LVLHILIATQEDIELLAFDQFQQFTIFDAAPSQVDDGMGFPVPAEPVPVCAARLRPEGPSRLRLKFVSRTVFQDGSYVLDSRFRIAVERLGDGVFRGITSTSTHPDQSTFITIILAG
jgi:hypothetical protein